MHKLDALVPRLLTWFAQNARDLPWRRTCDPYAIWVSEVMLQQTQVKTVIPYWERWMEHFPTVEHLAKARLEKVLKLWEGLGYYTRARNLHRAAHIIVQRHNGIFPRDFESVLALPGIGRYTAGAICSIAFNRPTPVLDGNVIRVLARLFAVRSNPHEESTSRELWQLAEGLVRRAGALRRQARRDCSHLNQALMELGATICTPREPNCGGCPVRKFCDARKQNRVHDFPNLGRRVGSTARKFLAFAIQHRGRFLVRQRPDGVVNAHLWEFPNVEVTRGKGDLTEAARACLGFVPDEFEVLATIKHTITRYHITLKVLAATAGHGLPAQFGAWRRLDELEEIAFPSAHRRIVAKLRAGHLQRVGSASVSPGGTPGGLPALRQNENCRASHGRG